MKALLAVSQLTTGRNRNHVFIFHTIMYFVLVAHARRYTDIHSRLN